LIPAGTEDTVPVPVPLLVTVRMLPEMNVAIQLSGYDVITAPLES
jgi:hypothetical protein